MKTFNLTFLPMFSVLMLSFLSACSAGGSDSSFDGSSGPNPKNHTQPADAGFRPGQSISF